MTALEETPPPPRPADDGEILFEAPPPLGEDPEALEGLAGLFGAATVAGGYDPVPIFAVAGVDVASGPGPDGAPAGPVALEGLSVRWGRDDVLDQADPATAKVTLFDPSRRWALEVDRVGQPATIRWVGGGMASISGYGSTTFFRGRIATCRPAPATHVYPDGTEVAGSLVTLTLTSVLADLANKLPTVDWPAETLGARRARVAAEAAAVLPNGLGTRAYWQDPQVAPVAAADQSSIWDHLLALYDSSGADRYTYWPADQLTTHLPRRYPEFVRGVAGLWWDGPASLGTPRAGKGVYIRSHAIARDEAKYPPQALYLDTAALELDPEDGLIRGPSSRITRVQVTNPDGANNYTARTTTQLTGVDEAVAGVRAARLESIVVWNAWADLSGSDLASFATKEGAAWHLGESVRWRTKLSDGFEDAVQGAVLLWGGELYSFFFLQRSWLPAYGIRPVFGVIGQTIGYRDGGWELELDLSPVVTGQPQHAITWAEIDDGSASFEVQWWDGDHPRGMHESLTFEDLGYCATGLNVTTIAPDRGFDRKEQ